MNTSTRFDAETFRRFMNDFETPEELRPGAIELLRILRGRGLHDLDEAGREILHRIYDGKLATSDDLEHLAGRFGDATIEEIVRFLENHDMTSDAFQKTIASRTLLEGIGEVKDGLELREATGVAFTPDERRNLAKLKNVLGDLLPIEGHPVQADGTR